MPYEYAIHSYSPDPDNPFNPTDEQTARESSSGHWRLVTHLGYAMTPWLRFTESSASYDPDDYVDIEATGQQIKPRDFVMTTVASRKKQVLGEVIGFTSQLVKVRIFEEDQDLKGKPSLKYKKDLVKIDKNMIF